VIYCPRSPRTSTVGTAPRWHHDRDGAADGKT